MSGNSPHWFSFWMAKSERHMIHDLLLRNISLKLFLQQRLRTSGSWRINVICTAVRMTFWEFIDLTALDSAVHWADGLEIRVGAGSRVQRLLLTKLRLPYCLQGVIVKWDFIWCWGLSAPRRFRSWHPLDGLNLLKPRPMESKNRFFLS